ncbi:MAG: hypothetical protein ACE5NG_02930 [bacterium]
MRYRREFWPRCQEIQNLRESRTETDRLNDDGQKSKIVIRSYHCEVYNTFVRSEEKQKSKAK